MEFDHYAIDAGLSTLSIRAFASSAFAVSENSPTLAIREFAGWARFVPRTFDQAYVHTKVNPGSLTVVESIAEEDRNAIEHTIRRSVLEIDKYPEVVFCSSRVSVNRAGDGQYWINLVGNLSLHGVTGVLPVAAQVAVAGNTLRVHGEFTFLRTIYKMKLVPASIGTLKLKDEVKCSFDILAHKQPDLATQESFIFAREGF